MSNLFWEILQFSCPAGFLGFIVSYLLQRSSRRANVVRDAEFAYRELYVSLRKDIVNLNSQIADLRSELERYKRMVSSARDCANVSNCPILRNYET